jgi:hypothetical protein
MQLDEGGEGRFEFARGFGIRIWSCTPLGRDAVFGNQVLMLAHPCGCDRCADSVSLEYRKTVVACATAVVRGFWTTGWVN